VNFEDENKDDEYDSTNYNFAELEVSNQKKLIFCGSQLSTVQCISSEKMIKMPPLGKTEQLTKSFVIGPNGAMLYTGSQSGTLKLFNLDSGEVEK
jgi:hypothetical protein